VCPFCHTADVDSVFHLLPHAWRSVCRTIPSNKVTSTRICCPSPYTGCVLRTNRPYFGTVFLRLNYIPKYGRSLLKHPVYILFYICRTYKKNYGVSRIKQYSCLLHSSVVTIWTSGIWTSNMAHISKRRISEKRRREPDVVLSLLLSTRQTPRYFFALVWRNVRNNVLLRELLVAVLRDAHK
jgi:hypothetical protein